MNTYEMLSYVVDDFVPERQKPKVLLPPNSVERSSEPSTSVEDKAPAGFVVFPAQ